MSRQIDQEIIQATDELKKDVALTTKIISGNENTVVEVAPGNTVRSPKKMIEDCYQETQQAIEEKFGSLDQAVADAQSASATAKNSETNADKSAGAALANKNAAKTSETNAATSASEAKSSETSASSSKTAAQASASSASTSAANAKTSETNADQSETAAAVSKNSAASSASSATDSKSAAASSAASANEQANRSKTQADRATIEADRAESEADRAGNIINTALQAAAIPLPDFHLPLNDNLMIREGIGTPYQEGIPLYHADFSRSSSKTYVSKSGELKIAQINEPAFEQEGILIEGPSTNLFINSNGFVGRSGSSVTVDSDGWYSTTSTGFELRSSYNSTEFSKVTLSCFVKGSGIISLETASYSAYSKGGLVTFNLDSFVVESTSSPKLVGAIKSFGSFSRITLTANFTIYNGSRGFYVNTNGNDIKVRDGQMELLPFASSYIQTVKNPLTRSADKITLSELPCRQDNGPVTLAIKVNELAIGNGKWNMPSNTYNKLFAIASVGGNNESVKGSRDPGGSFAFRWYLDEATSYWKTDYSKPDHHWVMTATSHKDIRMYEDGNKIAEVTHKTSAFDNLKNTQIGFLSSQYWWGHIKDFRIWNYALTPEQIAALD